MLTNDTLPTTAHGPIDPGLTNDVPRQPVDPSLLPDHSALAANGLNGLSLKSTMAVGNLIAVRVLATALISAVEGGTEADSARADGINLRDEVQRFEASLIKAALAYTGGRQRRAARLLGINVSTINERIKRYKLNSTQVKPG